MKTREDVLKITTDIRSKGRGGATQETFLPMLEVLFSKDYDFIYAYLYAYSFIPTNDLDLFGFALREAQLVTGKRPPYPTANHELTKAQADSIISAVTSTLSDSVLMYTER